MAHFSFGGNMKNNKNYILELILIFIVTILFNLFINGLTNDEVWNYGFAYNISNGLIPYKDFNMIITPLFFSFKLSIVKYLCFHLLCLYFVEI